MTKTHQLQKLNISSSNIKNQHRFPISRYGWPLKNVAKLILNGNKNWQLEAQSILKQHINTRLNMKTLYDLYKIKELDKWHIDSSFVPWFSQKPLLNKNVFDRDYTDPLYIDISIKKLCKLISSIEKSGFLVNDELKNNIIVYPINIEKKSYYVRAGNHRVAVLAAMKKNITCYLDDFSYLKPRDRFLISKYLWQLNTRRVYKNYPHINSIENWPSVKSRVLSIESANKILEIFN